MNIAVFGTGVVGQVIAQALTEKKHKVVLGTRDPAASKERKTQEGWGTPFGVWHAAHAGIPVATYAEAAATGEIVVNCTSGAGSLAALALAGEAALGEKILIDIANPLDFSKGMPPTLLVCNDDSLGEQIQRAHPRLKVVKTLNTMNAELMVNPGRLAGEHDVFVSGNDETAKARVKSLLSEAFGWPARNILDLGDITTARGTEQILPLWLRLYGSLKTADFNFHVVR
jgi:predicted dinucleotide-binding enzyme